MDKLYKKKYLKYKKKYLTLQEQLGGNQDLIQNAESIIEIVKKYSNFYYDSITHSKNTVKILSDIITKLESNKNVESNTINKLQQTIIDLLKLNEYNKSVLYDVFKSNLIKNTIKLISIYENNQPNKRFIKFIGAGGFGCVLSPPLILTKIVKQEFPTDKNINIDSLNEDYVAKILSCEGGAYLEELESNMLIKQFDKDGNYTPKMIFAGYMNRPELIEYIKTQKNTNTDQELKNIYNCLYTKLANNEHKYYGYIVYNKVGTSFDKLTNEINNTNIKPILISLSKAIRNLFNNLYTQGYIHGDFKLPNMTLKGNKVYIIDFGFTQPYDKYGVLNSSINTNYPIMLNILGILDLEKPKNFKATKAEYIRMFNEVINNCVARRIPTVEGAHELHRDIYSNLARVIPKYVGPSAPFKSYDDMIYYVNDFISIILEPMKTYEEDTIKGIFGKYFLDIARNIDVYAASLVIYQIFNYYSSVKKSVKPEISQLTSQLLYDAFINGIEGPVDLADRLDLIISEI
jgi:hypothetical protein